MKHYLVYLTSLFFFCSRLIAAEWVIETQEVLSSQKIMKLQKEGFKLEKLAPFSHHPEFLKIYEFQGQEKDLAKLKKYIVISNVEKNIRVEPHTLIKGKNISQDFLSGYQYYLKYTEQKIFRDITDIESQEINGRSSSALNAIEASDQVRSTKNEDVIVAVIDTGVDRHHPEISDAIYRNTLECDENGDIFPNPTDDKDGNGLVGDCQGWDFATPNKRLAHIVSDKAGHGTHISGILAAKKNDHGIMGLAPQVKILPIQVFNLEDRSPFTFISTVTKAVLYAVKMKAQVINLSLGWPYTLTPSTFQKALRYANEQGVLVVSSSGNDGNNQFVAPCALKGVLCVGASSLDGKKAPFSNHGLHVDFMAPGEEILSLYPTEMTPNRFSFMGYEILSGTSQATPLVAGSLALLKTLLPEASSSELVARLMLSTEGNSSLEGSASGIIKLDRALKESPKPLLRPIVKDFAELLVLDGKQFSFNLAIQNLWKQAGKTRVTLEIPESKMKLNQNVFEFESIDEGQTVVVKLSGQVVNGLVHSKVELGIKIETEGMPVFKRQHTIEVLSIISGQTIKENSQVLEMKPGEVLFYQGPELLSRLRTIPNFIHPANEKSYWIPLKNGVKLVRLFEGKLRPVDIVDDEFKELLSLEERDFNYDGVDDYLMRFSSQTTPEYIGYIYFDKSGQVIRKFKYYPESSVYPHGSGQFLKFQTPHGPLAFPVWTDRGRTPKADLPKDPWLRGRETQVERIHMYYLRPNPNKANELMIRVIDNKEFKKQLEETHGLREGDFPEWRRVSEQGVENYHDSTAMFMMGFEDRAFQWKSYRLEIHSNGNQLSLSGAEASPLRAYQFFGRVSPLYVMSEQSVEREFQLVSSQNESMMMVTDFSSGEDQLIKNRQDSEEQETLISTLAAYDGDHGRVYVVETDDRLAFFTKDQVSDEFVKRDQISLNRVSFFGHSAFRSSFVPMVHRNQDSVGPAVYQDSTFLGNRKLSLVTFDPQTNRVVAPIKDSYKIPSFCSTLNPIQKDHQVYFHMICDLNGELRLVRKAF